MQRLSELGCQDRRRRLIEAVAAHGLDALIITNPQHLLYLSGMVVMPTALSAYGPNFLLIDCKTGATQLLSHNFIAGEAQAATAATITIWRWYDAVTASGIDPYAEGVRQLNLALAEPPFNAAKRIGAEAGWLPHGIKAEVALNVTPILERMRRRKDDDELALIREAITAVEAAHAAARREIHAGMTELDAYNVVTAALVKSVGHSVLPMGDFAGGARSGDGGGVASRNPLRQGDLLILDLFPIVNGYRADFTATYAIDADHLPAPHAALERALHEALAAGEALLSPGIAARDVYHAVRKTLAAHDFDAGFTHHAGHGIGLGHPEAPYFVPESKDVIEVGDVVTLEPGSYTQGWGGRIEHNYLITATGFERLTHHDTRFIGG